MAQSRQFKLKRAIDPKVLLLEVLRSERISPSFIRVTFGGEGLQHFTYQGYDQWFRLFLQREEQDTLLLPTSSSSLWYAQFLAMPKDKRPWIRNYTVRSFRTDPLELDVDFVVHGDEGPATRFALNARPGDTVGLLDQGLGFNPRTRYDWVLLAADESGLPAVASVLNSLPSGVRTEAFIEIPDERDRQEMHVGEGCTVHWVVRSDPHAVPGQAVLKTVQEFEFPSGDYYAMLIGESGLPTGLRRWLVNEQGAPKTSIDFVGYWKQGSASSA